MGREVNRVPLDFEWPIGKVYEGFLMPQSLHGKNCPSCGQSGSGYSPQGSLFNRQWYGLMYGGGFRPEMMGSTPFTPDTPGVRERIKQKINHDYDGTGRGPRYYRAGTFNEDHAVEREANRMCQIWNESWSHHLCQDDVDALVTAGRLMDFTHTWTKGTGWKPKVPAYHPTAEEVNLWSLFGMGHDSINSNVCIRARAKREGVEYLCSTCDGHGTVWDSPEQKVAYDTWEPEELPKGEGWQMWENVSEGSPISPVFNSPEKLARWLSETGANAGGGATSTYAEWLKMITDGYAPSMIVSNGRVMTGVEASIE